MNESFITLKSAVNTQNYYRSKSLYLVINVSTVITKQTNLDQDPHFVVTPSRKTHLSVQFSAMIHVSIIKQRSNLFLYLESPAIKNVFEIFSTPYLLMSAYEYILLVSRARKICGVRDLSRHALKIWLYDSSLSSYDQR